MISVATSTRGTMGKTYPCCKRAVFSKGYAEAVACDTFDDFRRRLQGIQATQCLIMGHPRGVQAGQVTPIGTKGACSHGEIARTQTNFAPSHWFLADYDWCKQFRCRSASEVHANLCKLLPEVFEGAGYLATKSSSSRVLLGGKPIKPTSWHLYYRADDAFKVRFLAGAIMQAAEEIRMTYQKLSTDGKQLTRTVIDLSPLKIGGCGIVYEAPPQVSGEYTLAPSRVRTVDGSAVKTSLLQPAAKQPKRKAKPVSAAAVGYVKHSRKLHYSSAYRSLSLQQAAVLADIVVEYRGGNHGTPGNPIEIGRSRFRANGNHLKEYIDALVSADFIRYESGYHHRCKNRFYLNFKLLDMTPPRGWTW